MRLSTKIATVAGAAGVALTTVTAGQAAAATYPYRNWVRESGNATGAVFYPSGDTFRIWNNLAPGGPGELEPLAFVEWNYKNINDSWKRLGAVHPRSNASYSRNMVEGRRIYFRVCHYEALKHCSRIVQFRTGGRNP